MVTEVTTATIRTSNIISLGTASAQPSKTKQPLFTAIPTRDDVWLFDCGETAQNQNQKSNVRMWRIKKVFYTPRSYLWVFGLKPLLTSCMNEVGGITEGNEDPQTQIDTPLRFPSDPQAGDFTAVSRLPFELEDRNIPQANGVWEDTHKDTVVSVSAAPIQCSVSCVRHVVNEALVSGKIDPKKYIQDIRRTSTPMSVMRQLQQGTENYHSCDTHDSPPIAPLACDTDLLIHKATNARLPGIDPNTKKADTYESVEERTKYRGHSTPQMTGAFANIYGTKKIMGAVRGLVAG
ncbi:hypothetical protein P691DRAFT_792391 [Macrolepiota fuliginosa MF-IS2]|uniref:Uncharacterized protein n=1 Tax=Macrolepiota fuliginosa MF-IS2 TaxID=1400762 RepID=A0A9P5XCW0_9AGAR|nr:hypothetical protein P691DRAFT_792391 [Macrolepiota fuliginosa MF-IS2]